MTLKSLIRPLYWKVRTFAERDLLGTTLQEFSWRHRHLFKGKGWAKGYLKSQDHAHRDQIVEALRKMSPFDSVFELGCNSGPNLIRLAQEFPGKRFLGLDINRVAIEEGRKALQQGGYQNIELRVGKASELSQIPSQAYDFVLCDAVLMFIDSRDIKEVLRHLVRISKRALLLNEYHSEVPFPNEYAEGRYVRNYASILNEIAPDLKIQVTKSAFQGSGWDEFGYFVIAAKNNMS